MPVVHILPLPRRLARTAAVVCSAAAAGLAAWAAQAAAPAPAAADAAPRALRTEVVAQGLVNPWSLAWLPDGRMLVTERPGRMRLIAEGGKLGAPLAGLPPVAIQSQCGLLDVAVDPQFASTKRIYWSYAEPGDAGQNVNSTAVARGVLDGQTLSQVEVVFRQQPKVASGAHCGGRLAFAKDGRLFLTLGDRFSEKDQAQNLSNHLGKVVRIEPDGKAPADNPFVKQASAKPEIWSYGHRNVQGAAIHPQSGELWTHEHGPQGGDEVNITRAGKNHGWPLITYGRNYGTGTKIGEGTQRADVAAPVHHWLPTSIAPSGLAFLTSDRYGADWKGSLFVGALRAEALVRLALDGDKVVREERLLTGLKERIRDVRQGPDGYLYVLTDNASGRVLRVLPN